MNFRIISILSVLPFFTQCQCQKLDLNVSNVYIEHDRLFKIEAALENKTSKVIGIYAHNINNTAIYKYWVDAPKKGLELYSCGMNGIYPEIVYINPKSSIPFKLSFLIKKANRGKYLCKLVPSDGDVINCSYFEVRIEKNINFVDVNGYSDSGYGKGIFRL